jgi:outer membrane protein assembly factor BamB
LPPRGDADLVVLDGRLWAGDEAQLLRIDPAGRRIERRVNVRAGGLEASGMTADARRVYVLHRDGRLLTIDGRNDTKGAPVALHVPARWLAGAAGRSVIVALDGGFAAVDRTTGRTLWQTHVAARSFDAAGVAGTALWAHGSAPSGRDTVWRLDARSGRVTGRLALPEFGVSFETVVRGRLWVLTPGGRLQIVSGG